VADLCTVADVEALSGATVAQAEVARVERLIEMASGLVAAVCVFPAAEPTPAVVSMVTAGCVVRQMANPTSLLREGIAGWSGDYGAGMTLTEDDYAALEPWLVAPVGTGAYSVPLYRPALSYAGWPVDWWAHDLDSVPW
jgi:hypothetical protein